MKNRILTTLAIVLLLLTTAIPTLAENDSTEYPAIPALKVTKKENTDLGVFSESQLQLFGSLIGEFVLDGFKGQETLCLPDEMKALCVDNSEMYYVLRRQQYLVDAISVMKGGQIHDLRFLETILSDVQMLSSTRVQVKAYVRLAFCYLDDPEQRQSGVGQEILATLLKMDTNHYLIENYSEISSEYDSMRSDYLSFCSMKNNSSLEQEELADLYFSNRIEQLAICKELEKEALPENNSTEEGYTNSIDSCDKQTASNRTSVTYNRWDAATYANNEGSRYDLIFHRVTNVGDCTNFVSQALWVGYGGDKGDYFNWLNMTPNATYLQNCKTWAWQKYRMISGDSGWWGASKYISTSYLPSGPWMRVWQLWSYLSITSSGPRARKYNDGALYTSSSTIIRAGDILQFSSDPSSGYGHSVMVVNDANKTLGQGTTSIYVAQHSADYGWRQLSSVISSAGQYIRIIRPISGSY